MLTLGYRVQAVDSGQGRSLTARRSSHYVRETARENGIEGQDPVRATASSVRRWSTRRRALDTRGRAGDGGERVAADLQFPPRRAAATTTTTRATRRSFAGTERFAGRHRPPAALAGGSRLRRQARRGDRQRRHGGDAGAGDGQAGRARDDASALAELRVSRCPGRIRRAMAARAPAGEGGVRAVRWKNVLLAMAIFQLCAQPPAGRQGADLRGVRASLARTTTSKTHFTPQLQPLGSAPLPRPRRRPLQGHPRRHATVVTDTIETFTETRHPLALRRELAADIVVTATGLKLQLLGGIELTVDGAPVELGQDDDLQGNDVQRRPQPRVSHSATPTPHGRSSATSPANTCVGCSITWVIAATPTACRDVIRR